jgi:hypothetical protein
MNRVGIASIVLGVAGCMPPRVPSVPPIGTPVEPTFSLLPSGGRDVVVPVRSAARWPPAGPEYRYRYIVHVERSDGGGPLHAVCIDGERAYAAGERGILLRRNAQTAWEREESGTDRTIRGLVVVRRSDATIFAVDDSYTFLRRDTTGWHPKVSGSDATIFAVGDSGTILRRDTTGWHAEESGTKRDLYGIQVVGAALLAVGDGGTILEREETGTWRPVAAHTEADLRAIADPGIAVGRAGAIVDCPRWVSAERTSFACVPRPSPVDTDLWAFRGERGRMILGSGGLSLESEMGPGPAVYKTSSRFETTLRSAATNNYTLVRAGSDTVAVGDGGTIVISPADSNATTIHIPGSPTLHAVAFEMLDGFAVGAGGTLVHLQIDGARLYYIEAPAI